MMPSVTVILGETASKISSQRLKWGPLLRGVEGKQAMVLGVAGGLRSGKERPEGRGESRVPT